jgi:hypothetical protein
MPTNRDRTLAINPTRPQRLNSKRHLVRVLAYLVFLALALLGVVATSHASPATFSITVSRDSTVVLKQAARVGVGSTLKLDHLASIPMRGAVCSANSHSGVRVEQDGVVKSGFTVEIEPVSANGSALETIIHLANSEYVQAVPTSAGACNGATPAMLTYDSTASFDLQRMQSASLRVGLYVITVELIDAPPATSTGLTL